MTNCCVFASILHPTNTAGWGIPRVVLLLEVLGWIWRWKNTWCKLGSFSKGKFSLSIMHLIGIQIGWPAIHRWHIFFYICRHYLPVRRYNSLLPCRFQYFNCLFWCLRTNSQVFGFVYLNVMLLLWLWTKIEETFTFDGIDRGVRSSWLFIFV